MNMLSAGGLMRRKRDLPQELSMQGRLVLFVFVAASFSCLALTGCGPLDPRATIHGTVSLDGKPVANGQVIFIPADSKLAAAGSALKDGSFTVVVHKGPHQVKVEASVEERRSPNPNAPPEEAGVTYRSIIPPRYNEKSTLTFDVQSAQDKPAFDLTGDK